MIEFLIKSAISMAVLLLVYMLLLEKEKMHHFNRFYLLFSLLFSLIIPFLSYSPQTTNSLATTVSQMPTILLQEVNLGEKTQTFGLLQWIIAVYSLITAILLIRFTRNLLSFAKQIKNNKKISYKNATLVLLPYKTLPHTFLNYIFVSGDDHNKNAIEKDLYTHELAHVNQKHTMDILLAEILKTIFWFNPVVYFYKKAIQLNHEFLADEAVITTNHNTTGYQSLLLKLASGDSVALASNINFSITKKRFVMMTKTTPKLQALGKQLLIVPLMAGLFLISCADNETNKNNETESNAAANTEVESNAVEVSKSEPVTNEADSKEAVSETKDAEKIPPPVNKTEVVKVTEEKEIPSKSASDSDAIRNVAGLTKQPEYPGGMQAFYNYITENFIIPDIKEDKTLKVFVSFIVEKDGSMSNIKILRDPGYGLGEEALRVLKSIPKKWNPGEMNGELVRTNYTVPVTINVKS
ncbi:M56 family metallopeptidase [Flavobacterium beibuense]|uniref:Peptidase M56 BlaR1 n=1 Tax=Flavobacterium beibuense TaxID=657326 RepID=A0A444WBT4_9FLAO|nr:M56 family metallopeptidase [Flavobacterium beibuense]RYJ43297.1 Peptidase M56 BlaR1 [Flavobacterium beibuense]